MKNLILITLMGFFLSCGTINDDPASSEGNVDLRLWIDPGPAKPSSRETDWKDLIINIISLENDTINDTIALETSNAFNSFLLNNIKSEIQQTINAFTIDNAADTIHGPAIDTFTLIPGGTVAITMELFPIKGSMYLMLSNFPSYIDSVGFFFTTPTEEFSVKERKSTKFYTSLDKIPYGTTGTISVKGYDNSSTERMSWALENYTFTADDVTLEANFLDIGSTNLQMTIHEPGKTLIWGIMNDTIAAEKEIFSPDSQLIISEIMSSAGSGTTSADYIEIYNSSTTFDSLFFDTLIIITSNNSYTISNIGIKKEGFYTIGGPGVPNQSSWSINKIISLDFTSTSESIQLKNKNNMLLDKIFYVTQNGYMGWPTNGSSSKTSLVLDTLYSGLSPEYNNYGSNWLKAVTPIHSEYLDYLGTPGSEGN